MSWFSHGVNILTLVLPYVYMIIGKSTQILKTYLDGSLAMQLLRLPSEYDKCLAVLDNDVINRSPPP